MAMFDYRRKIEQLSPEMENNKEIQAESSLEEESFVDENVVEEVPAQAPPYVADMTVLSQISTDMIRPSVKVGILRVDFPDEDSSTKFGSMFVQTSDVYQSLTIDKRPIPGKADVVVSHDGQNLDSYFIVQDGSFVRSNKSLESFVTDWNIYQQAQNEKSRQNIETQVVEQVDINKERSMNYE